MEYHNEHNLDRQDACVGGMEQFETVCAWDAMIRNS
jgi:hypothetical protein